ncbi:hypothetical protein [Aeromicrobium sp. Root495]|uniref:hypothetical protein n=1 Tax=Aeromicrobium sp. Root495 TaxID=1736550 RepID=UPI000A87DF47|nr:hypothetical protein [Aeromicrobium sp. Root495]
MSEGAAPVLREVSKARFDAFAGYARKPEVALLAREVAWFESRASEVFAALIVDRDREFSSIIFAADLEGRFRWVTQSDYFGAIPEAIEALDRLAAQILADVGAPRAGR